MGPRSDSITAVPRVRRSEGSERRPALIVLGGADALAPPAEARILIFDDALEIGRHPPATELSSGARAWVVADRLVSGRHAVIRHVGRDWELNDLDSRNGTLVDGMRARPKLKLRDGSIVFVGGVAAIFRMLSGADVERIGAELRQPLAPVATCNPELARLCARMRRLSGTEGELLLTGETGVGKEIYAHAIHGMSGRTGRFVAINCAALPRELVESELFGYARGAHSQAAAAKPGLIEEAEGGTLFLDEIGEMAPDLQTKLLRFTQDRLLAPIGGTRARRVDVRILAATSRTAPPSASDPAGLRQDLAARLGAEPICIPPLRERREDLGALISYFSSRSGDLASGTASPPPLSPPRAIELAAFQTLCLHGWPGNVRELQKVITTAIILARGHEKLAMEHLPRALAASAVRARAAPAGRVDRRAAPTATELEDLIREHGGNMMKVARQLDRKPAVVYRWAKRFHLDLAAFRKPPEP